MSSHDWDRESVIWRVDCTVLSWAASRFTTSMPSSTRSWQTRSGPLPRELPGDCNTQRWVDISVTEVTGNNTITTDTVALTTKQVSGRNTWEQPLVLASHILVPFTVSHPHAKCWQLSPAVLHERNFTDWQLSPQLILYKNVLIYKKGSEWLE